MISRDQHYSFPKAPTADRPHSLDLFEELHELLIFVFRRNTRHVSRDHDQIQILSRLDRLPKKRGEIVHPAELLVDTSESPRVVLATEMQIRDVADPNSLTPPHLDRRPRLIRHLQPGGDCLRHSECSVVGDQPFGLFRRHLSL